MPRLSKAQKAFMEMLQADGEPGDWVECPRREWRTAVALVKKGLVQSDRAIDSYVPRDGFFDARLDPSS